MMLRTEIARTLDELEVHSDAWNSLALQAPQQLPMLSHAWVASFFQYRVKTDESWFCVFSFEGDSLMGVLPLIVKPHPLLGLRRPVLNTPFDNHTICVDMFAQRGHEEKVLPLLIQAAVREYPNLFSLEFRRLPEVSPTFAVLSYLHRGFSGIKEYDGAGDFLKVDGDFEAFWGQLSSSTKRNLRNRNKKLNALAGEQSTVSVNTGDPDIWLRLFMEVEASSWKGRGGSALLNSQSLIDFYDSLTDRLSKAGWLEWHFLQAADETFAGNLAIKFGRILVIWKLGYRDSYAKCAPGSLLFEQVLRLSFNDSVVQEINLLTDMPWHKQWNTHGRDYYNFYLYPTRFLPWLLGALPRRMLIALRRVPGLRWVNHQIAMMSKKLRRS